MSKKKSLSSANKISLSSALLYAAGVIKANSKNLDTQIKIIETLVATGADIGNGEASTNINNLLKQMDFDLKKSFMDQQLHVFKFILANVVRLNDCFSKKGPQLDLHAMFDYVVGFENSKNSDICKCATMCAQEMVKQCPNIRDEQSVKKWVEKAMSGENRLYLTKPNRYTVKLTQWVLKSIENLKRKKINFTLIGPGVEKNSKPQYSPEFRDVYQALLDWVSKNENDEFTLTVVDNDKRAFKVIGSDHKIMGEHDRIKVKYVESDGYKYCVRTEIGTDILFAAKSLMYSFVLIRNEISKDPGAFMTKFLDNTMRWNDNHCTLFLDQDTFNLLFCEVIHNQPIPFKKKGPFNIPFPKYKLWTYRLNNKNEANENLWIVNVTKN